MIIGIFTTNPGIFENLQFYLEEEGHEAVWLNPHQMPRSIKVDKTIIDPHTEHPSETRPSLRVVLELAERGDAALYIQDPNVMAHILGVEDVNLPVVEMIEVGLDIARLLCELGL